MIYIVLLALVFIFAAASMKLAGKKIELLENRVYSLEERVKKIMDTTTAEAVANGDAVEVNTETEVVSHEFTP